MVASEDAINAGLSGIRARLARVGLKAEDCGTIEIVLAEVLNNVAEHAYAPGPSGVVDIALRLGPCAMQVTIRDRGRPLPDLRLPEGHAPDLEVARGDLPEGGFGWLLIRSLTRDLDYRRDAGENRLAFSIPLERAQNGGAR